MPVTAFPISCLIWPDYEAALGVDLDFYVDSPRAGGRYEFYLPNFDINSRVGRKDEFFLPAVDIKLPTISAQTMLSADGKAAQTHYAAYNKRLCNEMQRILDAFRNKRRPLLFEAMLSRMIYNTKEHVFEINPIALEVAKHLASRQSTVRKTLTVAKRAGFLAKHLAANPIIPKGHFSWQGLSIHGFAREAMAASCSRNFAELVEAAQFLENKEYIKLREFGQETISVKIQPSLLGDYGEPETRGDEDECFVAMSFAKKPDLVALFNAIKLGAESSGYRAVRIDREEHINKIDDEILARIRRAKFVVADLTGQNPNVCYEAGFAQGLGRKIIFVCQKSEVDKRVVNFDLSHYNMLTWEESNLSDDGDDNLSRRLQNRIEAVFGKGTYKPKSKVDDSLTLPQKRGSKTPTK